MATSFVHLVAILEYYENKMKQFDINEVKDYIRQSSPESKIYLGADSERTRLDKVWWAHHRAP